MTNFASLPSASLHALDEAHAAVDGPPYILIGVGVASALAGFLVFAAVLRCLIARCGGKPN